MSFPQQLKVDTDIPQQHASHPSAIIAVPTSWSSTESLQAEHLDTSTTVSPKDCSMPTLSQSLDLSALPQPEPPLPLSSTSSRPPYPWPAPPNPDELLRDPFDATSSFSEDPYAQSSASSSGDDWDARIAATTAHVALPEQTPAEWHPQGRTSSSFTGINRTFASSKTVGSLLQPKAAGGGPYDARHSVSRELVDSLQTAIQTLLYVSPPHLLDNAKEQYSGCAIQMPTTSVSALFTSIRGLNYLSANLVSLCEGKSGGVSQLEDFDIGELLQNVADQLSGDMALSEVDLVLFHGDIGMKHINMNGDRAGIAYVLGHVLRQILAVANKGDTIEMGLQIVPQGASVSTRQVSLPRGHNDAEMYRRRASSQISLDGQEGPFMCVFEIVHNVAQHIDSNAATPKAELNPFTRLAEQREAATPKLNTPLCHQLLRQVNAWLKTDAVPSSPSNCGLARHAYEMGVVLGRGAPIVEPPLLSPEEEATRQPFSGLLLPREPTLTELAEFAETLRGKRVNLHASLSSVFARHLTSYLAAWGLDVSHIPIEENIQSANSPVDVQQARFVIIDGDVAVLRRELIKLKADTLPSTVQRQRSFKRPGLFRSTRSAMAVRQNSGTVIIHFTSLDKYHQVRDVVASIGVVGPPEVMVVPKPVGPRRFLTALFTAIKQPAVDPAFSPIATSPRSPHISSGSHTPTGTLQEGFFDGVDLPPSGEGGITKARSPLAEYPPSLATATRPSHENLRLPNSSSDDLVTTPAFEYFSRTNTSRQTSTGASGVVIQSPDGRPFGMFFEPPSSATTAAPRADTSRRTPATRQASLESDHATMSESPNSSRRPSAVSGMSEAADESNNAAETMPSGTTSPATAPTSQPPSRRKTLPTAPDAKPVVAQGRGRSSTATRRQTQGDDDSDLPNISARKGVPRNPKESEAVIPPINVLIVEDNPINQNILSMFFKRKKIKHQTAKDGQEAVEKWQTGGFHLILMDIQLPVMDGIEATKEIRKLEKRNNVGVFPSTPTGEVERPIEAVPPSSPFRSSVIIVALTASSLQTDRVAALAAGCNDFLTKPVSLKWLERKTVEWGCMQALIDFDGWRR